MAWRWSIWQSRYAPRAHQTLEEIHAAGGPSPNTVGRLSRFDRTRHQPWPLRPATLAELDTGIDGWEPNDAQRLYDLPAEPIGVVITDVDQFAELVGAHLLELLVERLQLRLGLADAAQTA